MSREAYIAALRESALLLAKRLTMQYIVGRFPFVGLAFPNAIVGLVVGKVLEIALQKTELGLFFAYVDVRTSRQGREFEASMSAYLMAQKGGYGPEAKRLAEDRLINSFESFVRFSG
jgi:hypothetical protein